MTWASAAAVEDRPLEVRCLSLELSCSGGEADLHGRQPAFAVHPMGRPAGCRADYQSGVKTGGERTSRYRRTPEPQTPVKDAA